jgi:hypothetical protein
MRTEQDLLERIKQLSARQRAEVVDFIDFLVAKQSRSRPLLDAMQTAAPRTEVSLQDVRRRLSTIRGSMAATVNEMRDDRV